MKQRLPRDGANQTGTDTARESALCPSTKGSPAQGESPAGRSTALLAGAARAPAVLSPTARSHSDKRAKSKERFQLLSKIKNKKAINTSDT